MTFHPNRRRVAVLVCTAALASVAMAQQARFFAIPGQSAIPGRNDAFCGLSGTTGYSGTRVSEDGRVAGTVVFVPGNYGLGYVPRRAAKWTEAEGTVVISPELSGLYPVTGLSADGSVIYGENWRWTAARGYENLTNRLNPAFILSRRIFGCSSDGRTVTGTDGGYPAEADLFTWRIDEGPVVNLPRESGFPQGYFYFNTISGDGRVVAGSTRRFVDLSSSPDTYAPVLITPSGPVVIGGESSQTGVTDLSRDGSVAVGYLSQGFQLRAFRWTAAGGIQLLDNLDGTSNSSYARAVNADGEVVVGDYLNFGQDGTRAWIWRSETGFTDLYSELVYSYGLENALAGWTLLVATDISADGRTIVGQGLNPEGCEQAFMVRYPGPVCRADFDGSGTVSLQDLFSFLVAYFTGNPRADMNGADGVTVQDIFDYLVAYFNGCN